MTLNGDSVLEGASRLNSLSESIAMGLFREPNGPVAISSDGLSSDMALTLLSELHVYKWTLVRMR